MSCGNGMSQGFGQFMVDQRPKFDNAVRKKKRRQNGYQVQGKNLIHPDKRHKVKYL